MIAASPSPALSAANIRACLRAERPDNATKAAQAYSDRHAIAWGRLRTLEAQLGQHAAIAAARNELNPGEAWGFAGDLERLNALLAEAIRVLGGAA